MALHSQISAPTGSSYYHGGNYPPARGPAHTLPLSNLVPDEAIINGTSATMPRSHQFQQIREQGRRESRGDTLSGQPFNLSTGDTFGTHGSPLVDSGLNFENLFYQDGERLIESQVLKQNRARLTQYIHDCTLLFPYMREKNVFNRTDCDIINHEITGTLKMDTFIDIVLTKGPKAIGVFHEALDTHYPAVFDVLSGLFANAGVTLPENRQKKERPEYDDESFSRDEEDDRSITIRGRRGREGIRTIRYRLKELSKHCEKVQSQRDELQNTLLMREQDIDGLISRIDRQDTQNSELMTKLEHWLKALTDQSNGSIQQLGEIIQEKESIQKEYSELAGELELTVSELMAARDRIGKLLINLDRTDKQAAATEEANEKLQEKVQIQNGEIQKLLRKIDRLKSDGPSSPVSGSTHMDKRIEELEDELAKLKVECEQLKEQTTVASQERKYALDEKDQALSKLHTEKTKNSRLKAKVKDLDAQLNDASSVSSNQGQLSTLPRNQVEDSTIFMTTENSGLELGLAVVVRNVSDSSKAYQEGVRMGDEIREVNRVKVTSEISKDPLEFARQILSSVSQQIVTLTIRRQAPPTIESSTLRGMLDVQLRDKHQRKVSSQSGVSGFSKPGKHFTPISAKSSSTSTRSHDTSSGDDTHDSVSLTDHSESQSDGVCPDVSAEHRVSQMSNVSEISEPGVVQSPRNSLLRGGCYSWVNGHRHKQRTMNGVEFGGPPSDETSPSAVPDSDGGYHSLPAGGGNLSRKAAMIVRKHRNRERMKISKSLDDMNKVKLPSRSPVLDEVSTELRSHIRQVIIHHGQWGEEFSITGGRGNGLFVQSNCTIRGLNSGDQILQIGDHPTKYLTYAEALEMISGMTDSYYYMLVAENTTGYEQLLMSDTPRDNFYVRARYTHHKSRGEFGMDYLKGDVFHVIDTKPQEYPGYWQVEKVKRSNKEPIIGGYIPVTLGPHETIEGTNSLPPTSLQSPKLYQRRLSPSILPPYKVFSAKESYEFYQPIHEIAITLPRPLVLLGACEIEVRKGLVEEGVIEGVKFAFCLREPAEKLEYMSQDQIVETVVTEGEVFKSIVDHVTGAANQGYHCVLCLRHEELIKPGVASLHPIVLILTPRRGFKGFRDSLNLLGRKNQVDINYSNLLNRKYDTQISGEVALTAGMCLDDALRVVRETVARKQGEIVWEADT